MLKREYFAPIITALGVDKKIAALMRLDDQKSKKERTVLSDLTRGRTWNLLIFRI
jgi:hypothetical protein